MKKALKFLKTILIKLKTLILSTSRFKTKKLDSVLQARSSFLSTGFLPLVELNPTNDLTYKPSKIKVLKENEEVSSKIKVLEENKEVSSNVLHSPQSLKPKCNIQNSFNENLDQSQYNIQNLLNEKINNLNNMLNNLLNEKIDNLNNISNNLTISSHYNMPAPLDYKIFHNVSYHFSPIEHMNYLRELRLSNISNLYCYKLTFLNNSIIYFKSLI
jgi:hypothetical protein